MKKSILLLVCACLIVLKVFAQTITPQPFNAYFDVQDSQPNRPKVTVGRQVIADSSGIYCFSNTVGADSADSNAYYLNGSTAITKYSYTGTLLWKKWYQSPGHFNYINSWNNVIKTGKGFLITGVDANTAIRDSAWVYQPFLFWVDTAGDSIRLVKHIDSLHDRTLMCATEMPDHNIIAAGIWGSASRTYNSGGRRYNPDSQSLYLVKYDSSGLFFGKKFIFPISSFR